MRPCICIQIAIKSQIAAQFHQQKVETITLASHRLSIQDSTSTVHTYIAANLNLDNELTQQPSFRYSLKMNQMPED